MCKSLTGLLCEHVSVTSEHLRASVQRWIFFTCVFECISLVKYLYMLVVLCMCVKCVSASVCICASVGVGMYQLCDCAS